MHIYKTAAGLVATTADTTCLLPATVDWDLLMLQDDPATWVKGLLPRCEQLPAAPDPATLELPIGSQEIWAAGVTYYRSRDARMEESEDAGGADFYARVYNAPRPELFFKSPPSRARAPGADVRIRADATWNVPEPELVLCINAAGTLIGCMVGNDMSSRDIEGENPLYLPQAKVYDGCCALGPGMRLGCVPLTAGTAINMTITRDDDEVFSGRTDLSQLKRRPEELIAYLYRECTFPAGVYLMTGTGIVPSADFSLAPGDRISIHIDGIGELTNTVA
jgi:2-dehydro-3-deoxy-D-arabinonate dehydratase